MRGKSHLPLDSSGDCPASSTRLRDSLDPHIQAASHDPLHTRYRHDNLTRDYPQPRRRKHRRRLPLPPSSIPDPPLPPGTLNEKSSLVAALSLGGYRYRIRTPGFRLEQSLGSCLNTRSGEPGTGGGLELEVEDRYRRVKHLIITPDRRSWSSSTPYRPSDTNGIHTST